MPSQYETKRYDFNLYYDGYDQLALSAYRLFRDRDGDLNAETQQDDTYFFSADETEATLRKLFADYTEGDNYTIDDWHDNPAHWGLPDSVMDWVSELPIYLMTDYSADEREVA